jgi:hypothetical protein
VIVGKMADYNPQVYNFVLSPEFSDSVLCWELKNYQVELPTFSVLLDHTLAVIWHVFNNDGVELTNLNKADLSWALRFLEAIDTSQINDTTDLDRLIDYLRKILISRYSMEDEGSILDETQTMLDSIAVPSSSSALEEFYNSFEVNKDIKREQKLAEKLQDVPKCSDEELLKKLQLLNPLIMSLDDVATLQMP